MTSLYALLLLSCYLPLFGCLQNSLLKVSIQVSIQKNCFLADFFSNEKGGYPSPPLTENHCAQKSLPELGGTPAPLT